MSSQKEQGFVHLLVLVLGLSGALFVSALIPINRHYNSGKADVFGVSLAKGDEDNSSKSSGSEDSKSHDSGSSGSSTSNSPSGSAGFSSGGASGVGAVIQSIPKPAKVETKEVKEKIESNQAQNHRVETKVSEEKIKSDIRQGNLRVKFEIENGKVKVETKVKKAGSETELEDEAEEKALKETELELEKAGVRVATAPGQLALVNKRAGALSNFPLSVDPTTRQLTVTTPAGTKIVTVLPQQAIDNMLAAKVMDDVVSEKTENNLASVPNLVKLETENGVLGYKVKGTKNHKLLGLIPVQTAVEAFVSAENGQVVESTESLLGKILSRLAP